MLQRNMGTLQTEKVISNVTAILKSLECSICLELLQNPVSTGCGHFFCRFCITETLQSSYRKPCPLCKKSFTRRGIQEASQRSAAIKAARKLAEKCEELTGINFFSKGKEKNTASTVVEPTLKTQEDTKSATKKRKSNEISETNDVEALENRNVAIKYISKKQEMTEILSLPSEEIIPSIKRYCQKLEDEVDDEDYDLPNLADLFQQDSSQDKKSVSSDLDLNNASYCMPNLSPEKVTAKNMSANIPDLSLKKDTICKNSKIEVTPEQNENKRKARKSFNVKRKTQNMSEKVKNKKNALKNKTNLINGTETEKEGNSDLKVNKDNLNDFDEENGERTKENKSHKRSLVNSSEKQSSEINRHSGRRSKTLRSECLDNLTEEEKLITKIREAEEFPLVVLNERNNALPHYSPVKECLILSETNIPVSKKPETIKIHEKCDDITDTAISVQAVTSPQINKTVISSKSPGWSRVKKVKKDFRVKKFSKLSVEKNSFSNNTNEVPKIGDDCTGDKNIVPVKFYKISEGTKMDDCAPDTNVKTNLMFPNNEKNLEGNDEKAASEMNSDKNSNEKYPEVVCNENDANSDMEIELQVDMVDVQNKEDDSLLPSNLSSLKQAKICDEASLIPTKVTSTQSANNLSFIENTNKTVIQRSDSPNAEYNTMAEDFQNENSCTDFNDFHLTVPTLVDNINAVTPEKENSTCMLKSNIVSSDYIQNSAKQSISIADANLITPNTEVNIPNQELLINTKQNDKFSRFPISSLVKESVSKISKISKHDDVSESIKDKVYFIEHSQQTSQRLDFYDLNNHNFQLNSLIPFKADVEPNAVLKYNNYTVVPKNPPISDKTKVVKRTCLTLEEVQDVFAKSNSSGQSETICSLPFLSGSYKLHICVSEETLNISVLKVESSVPCADSTNLNCNLKNSLNHNTNVLLVSEKSIQTSTCNSPVQSPTVLPSSNAASDASQPDNFNNPAAKPNYNPFPYLSKFFSDSESSPQLQDNSDVHKVTVMNTKETFPMPTVDEELPNQIEETIDNNTVQDFAKELTKNDVENNSNISKLAYSLAESDIIGQTEKKSGLNEHENHKVFDQDIEMIDLSSQDSIAQDVDSSILNNQCTPKRDNDLENVVPHQSNTALAAHYSKLMEESKNLSSDPDMVFANELVAPLQSIAERMNSTAHTSRQDKLGCSATLNQGGTPNPKQSLSNPEEILSLIKENSISVKSSKPKSSRLSLKSKKSSKFKRIQNYDSDSDSETQPKSVINTSCVKSTNKDFSRSAIQDQSTLNSLLSDDVNSSEIVKEIQDIDEKIKSVEEQLKQRGLGDLISQKSLALLLSKSGKKSADSDHCSSEESEDSDDLFSQSIPPTPPNV